MNYVELAFVVLSTVVILQALGRKLPVPMAALQIAAGAVLSNFAELDDLHEQTSLLFAILVPPLLYIEAWQVPKRELWRSIKPVLGLAIGLVALTTVVIGYGLHALLPEMPLAVAMALAAALASTDTVAVRGVISRMPLPPRLQTLLSGESLLNDAVALVAFKVAVAAAVTAQFSPGEAAVSLVTVSAGGLFIGAVVAVLGNVLRRSLISGSPESIRIDTVLSLLIPYAAYLAADKQGVSGVLAVVAAGLCGGVLDRRHLGAATRLNGIALWSTVTMTLNGAVFVMLGLEMRQVLHRVEGYSRWNLLGYVALLTLALFALRMAWTLLMAWWSGRQCPAGEKDLPSFTMLLVTVMCGVRGSLALSAALAIPLLTQTGLAMPERDLAVFLAAATVGATLLLSGLVLPFLKIDSTSNDASSMSLQEVHAAIARTALIAIDGDPLRVASSKVREWSQTWRGLYESRAAAFGVSNASGCAEHRRDLATQQRLSMNVLTAQRRELARLHLTGALTSAVRQAVEVELDLAEIAVDKMAWRATEPA
jgi:Na+/H+ antiporter